MERNIPHIAVLDKAVTHLDKGLANIHNKLSNLYVLLNRPLDTTSQQQALTLLHDAMGRLRELQEDKSYIINSAIGLDSDIEQVIQQLGKLRIQAKPPAMPVDTIYRGEMVDPEPSPLRTAASQLDDLIVRGQLNERS